MVQAEKRIEVATAWQPLITIRESLLLVGARRVSKRHKHTVRWYGQGCDKGCCSRLLSNEVLKCQRVVDRDLLASQTARLYNITDDNLKNVGRAWPSVDVKYGSLSCFDYAIFSGWVALWVLFNSDHQNTLAGSRLAVLSWRDLTVHWREIACVQFAPEALHRDRHSLSRARCRLCSSSLCFLRLHKCTCYYCFLLRSQRFHQLRFPGQPL